MAWHRVGCVKGIDEVGRRRRAIETEAMATEEMEMEVTETTEARETMEVGAVLFVSFSLLSGA